MTDDKLEKITEIRAELQYAKTQGQKLLEAKRRAEAIGEPLYIVTKKEETGEYFKIETMAAIPAELISVLDPVIDYYRKRIKELNDKYANL